MPRLTEATRQRRRETIADAAMRCFERRGFAASSMADIIDEAGSSAGSVYAHFTSKAELVRFSASTVLHGLVGALNDEMPAEQTPARVLERLLKIIGRARGQTLVQIWAEVPRDRELETFMGQSVLETSAIIREALAPWCAAQSTLRKTTRKTLAANTTEAVMAAIQGYCVRVTIDRGIDEKMLARRLVDAFRSL